MKIKFRGSIMCPNCNKRFLSIKAGVNSNTKNKGLEGIKIETYDSVMLLSTGGVVIAVYDYVKSIRETAEEYVLKIYTHLAFEEDSGKRMLERAGGYHPSVVTIPKHDSLLLVTQEMVFVGEWD